MGGHDQLLRVAEKEAAAEVGVGLTMRGRTRLPWTQPSSLCRRRQAAEKRHPPVSKPWRSSGRAGAAAARDEAGRSKRRAAHLLPQPM